MIHCKYHVTNIPRKNISHLYIKKFSVSLCVILKKLELLNRLRLFMDHFVCYIHGKVCSLSSV